MSEPARTPWDADLGRELHAVRRHGPAHLGHDLRLVRLAVVGRGTHRGPRLKRRKMNAMAESTIGRRGREGFMEKSK